MLESEAWLVGITGWKTTHVSRFEPWQPKESFKYWRSARLMSDWSEVIARKRLMTQLWCWSCQLMINWTFIRVTSTQCCDCIQGFVSLYRWMNDVESSSSFKVIKLGQFDYFMLSSFDFFEEVFKVWQKFNKKLRIVDDFRREFSRGNAKWIQASLINVQVGETFSSSTIVSRHVWFSRQKVAHNFPRVVLLLSLKTLSSRAAMKKSVPLASCHNNCLFAGRIERPALLKFYLGRQRTRFGVFSSRWTLGAQQRTAKRRISITLMTGKSSSLIKKEKKSFQGNPETVIAFDE